VETIAIVFRFVFSWTAACAAGKETVDATVVAVAAVWTKSRRVNIG